MRKLDFDLTEEVKKDKSFQNDLEYIPTGLTLLNLALSDNPFGGYTKGKIVNVVGDSHSGKTFLFWGMAAEVCYDKRYKDYIIAHNDAEHGSGIDEVKLFGEKIKRVEKKKYETISIEKNFANIKKLFNGGEVFIHCTDSLDSIKSKEEIDKPDNKIGERDYPDKPRIISEQLSILSDMADQTDSLIFIISQTRKAIGVMFGDKLRRTGGDALRFHSWTEFWLAKIHSIKNKDKQVGTQIRLKVRKNKETGKLREIEFPIFNDYGLDDIGSIVDWMIAEKFWEFKRVEGKKDENKKRKRFLSHEEREEKEEERKSRVIDTCGDFILGTRDKLINYIEEHNLENDLRHIVGECWQKVEEEISSKRKARYADIS